MLCVAVKLEDAKTASVSRAVRMARSSIALAFYPSSRANARLPETMQFRFGPTSRGTLSVSVPQGDPKRIVRAARVRVLLVPMTDGPTPP